MSLCQIFELKFWRGWSCALNLVQAGDSVNTSIQGKMLKASILFRLTGWPENTDPRSVDPLTDPAHGLPYGLVHGALLRTLPPYGPPQKNRRNVEVCEIMDSDEVSWIPGMMPYDPLDTIRLIQQRIDFLLDFFSYDWIKFELHSNCCNTMHSRSWFYSLLISIATPVLSRRS